MGTSKGNAVAGVGARNGVEKTGSGDRTKAKGKARRPALASALVAILDRHGMVVGILPSHGAARSFLRGGCP